jgi:hypothetical protein
MLRKWINWLMGVGGKAPGSRLQAPGGSAKPAANELAAVVPLQAIGDMHAIAKALCTGARRFVHVDNGLVVIVTCQATKNCAVVAEGIEVDELVKVISSARASAVRAARATRSQIN